MSDATPNIRVPEVPRWASAVLSLRTASSTKKPGRRHPTELRGLGKIDRQGLLTNMFLVSRRLLMTRVYILQNIRVCTHRCMNFFLNPAVNKAIILLL